MVHFIEEVIILATTFTIIFGILMLSIYGYIGDDSYTRRLDRLRNYKCDCFRCNNYK